MTKAFGKEYEDYVARLISWFSSKDLDGTAVALAHRLVLLLYDFR